MKLVAVPAGVFQHADLREPLRDEVVVADASRARERAWHARRPAKLDVDGLARPDGLVERNAQHRLVEGGPVVRRDERGPIDAVLLADADQGHVDAAEVLEGPAGQRAVAPALLLAHPGRVAVAPGVPVE